MLRMIRLRLLMWIINLFGKDVTIISNGTFEGEIIVDLPLIANNVRTVTR